MSILNLLEAGRKSRGPSAGGLRQALKASSHQAGAPCRGFSLFGYLRIREMEHPSAALLGAQES
jgi:hypothetical protein